MLDTFWDDVLAGPHPESSGLSNFKKINTLKINDMNGEGSSMQQTMGSLSTPSSPGAPMTPTTPSPRKDNVWRSVFSPRSNLATRGTGSQMYDKPEPNSPTVYDWRMYSCS